MGSSGELATTSLRRLRAAASAPPSVAEPNRPDGANGAPRGETHARRGPTSTSIAQPVCDTAVPGSDPKHNRRPSGGRGPRAEDEPGRLPPRRRRRRHTSIGLPAHASVLWQEVVCSSSFFTSSVEFYAFTLDAARSSPRSRAHRACAHCAAAHTYEPTIQEGGGVCGRWAAGRAQPGACARLRRLVWRLR